MLASRNTDWPLRYVDSGQSPLPRGGIAPLRQELALAQYLEKQASHRAAAARRFDLWTSAIRFWAQAADFGNDAFHDFRLLTGERRR